MAWPSEPERPDALVRLGRSPSSWPLRHPALSERKRHRSAMEFQPPNVRFNHLNAFYSDIGGPYVGDDPWEESRPVVMDNRIRDRSLEKTKPMTVEDLIRALQDKQWGDRDSRDSRQSEEFGTAVAAPSALRFGGMLGRK